MALPSVLLRRWLFSHPTAKKLDQAAAPCGEAQKEVETKERYVLPTVLPWTARYTAQARVRPRLDLQHMTRHDTDIAVVWPPSPAMLVWLCAVWFGGSTVKDNKAAGATLCTPQSGCPLAHIVVDVCRGPSTAMHCHASRETGQDQNLAQPIRHPHAVHTTKGEGFFGSL